MESGHYDGLHVETEYIKRKLDEEDNEAHQQDFRGYDIWTDTRPDTIGNGANVIELPLDRRQDFNINPFKCFKRCTEDGVCTFNAHFWKFFDTKDEAKDFLLDENDDKTFYMMGYFEIQDLEYRGEKRLAAGMSDDIKVMLGRVRNYELSQSITSFAQITASAAAIATLLLF